MHAARALTTIFTKLPRAGEAKTRLCPPLTPEDAARLSAAMLADTIAKCVRCTAFETTLCVAPAGEENWFRARFPEVRTIEAQSGADLGERMAHHFAHANARHPEASLVCIGSDAPHVPVERIVAAHAALARGVDVVLGPDRGGGYYLVGLRRSTPELFTGVPMSTLDMCERTRALASSLGLSVELLEADYDIDLPADAARLLHAILNRTAECRGALDTLHHTARELARLFASRP